MPNIEGAETYSPDGLVWREIPLESSEATAAFLENFEPSPDGEPLRIWHIGELALMLSRRSPEAQAFLKTRGAQPESVEDTALEINLFDSTTETGGKLGVRLISVEPGRAFLSHIHPKSEHFIFLPAITSEEGSKDNRGIIYYDGQPYDLDPGDTCLVRRGIVHDLGAGPNGRLIALVWTNNPLSSDHGDYVQYIGTPDDHTATERTIDY